MYIEVAHIFWGSKRNNEVVIISFLNYEIQDLVDARARDATYIRLISISIIVD